MNLKQMNKKQEIISKMKEKNGFCIISIDEYGKLSSPKIGIPYGGPTKEITIYRNSVEELLIEIDNMSDRIKERYGSPYGNATCKWS